MFEFRGEEEGVQDGVVEGHDAVDFHVGVFLSDDLAEHHCAADGEHAVVFAGAVGAEDVDDAVEGV